MQLNSNIKYYSPDELVLILNCAKNTLRYDSNFPLGIKIDRCRIVCDKVEVRIYLESNRIQ